MVARYRKMRIAARQCAIVGVWECWQALLTAVATSGLVRVAQSRLPTREVYGCLAGSRGGESPVLAAARHPEMVAGHSQGVESSCPKRSSEKRLDVLLLAQGDGAGRGGHFDADHKSRKTQVGDGVRG